MELDILGEEHRQYRVLETALLEKWQQQLAQLTEYPLTTPATVVFQYYAYLEACNHFYANLALPSRSHFSTQLSQQYCIQLLGRVLTPQAQRRLVIGLAQADIESRLHHQGHPLSPTKIADYHAQVLQIQLNVCASAWKNTLFHKHPELGFGLVGNIGHRRVLVQQQVPIRIGMLLTDMTMRKTIMMLPTVSALGFLKDMLVELNNTIYDPHARCLLELGARYWLREAWQNCFELIHAVSNRGISLLNEELGCDIDRLAWTLSMPYQLHDYHFEGNLSRQLLGLCCRVIVSRHLFQLYLPGIQLDLRQEAFIAYMKYYRQHVPPEVGCFISRCSAEGVFNETDACSISASTPVSSIAPSEKSAPNEAAFVQYSFGSDPLGKLLFFTPPLQSPSIQKLASRSHTF